MSEGKKKAHYGFVIVFCCCLMMGVNTGAAFSCAGIFFEPVSQALGVKVGEFSVYVSLMYVTSALMLSVAGGLLERYSARWIFTGSSAVMGLAFLLMATATALWQFYLAGAVLGVTLAFLMYLSFPTLINRWFQKRVGVMIGICAAASGLGGLLLNPAAGWLIENFGWRWGYGGFSALILLIVTPLLGLLLRDRPSDKGLLPYGAEGASVSSEKGKSPETKGVEYRVALRRPVFYAVAIFSFIMMGVSTLNLFIPGYVTNCSFTTEQASLVAGIVMGGAAVGKIVLGWINDRNCAAGVAVTTLGGALGLAVLIFGSGSLAMLFVGAFLFGWEYSGVTVQTAMLTKYVFGTRDYARIYSVVSIALAAGGALAASMWGALVEVTGYQGILWCGIGAMAVALVIALLSCLKK